VETNGDPSRAVLLGFLLGDAVVNGYGFLAVEPRLGVLYGLNGAGKSRTLDDIRNFWLGQRSDAIALVRLPESPLSVDWYSETEQGDWYPEWARRGDLAVGAEHQEIIEAWLRACMSVDDYATGATPNWGRRLDQLVSEWSRERLILVRAGLGGRGWVSAPAFITGPDLPGVNSEIAHYESLPEDDVSRDAECAVLPMTVLPDGRTVACASQLGMLVLDPTQWWFSAGRHDQLIDLSLTLFQPADDVDDETRRYLAAQVPEPLSVVEGELRVTKDLKRCVRDLEDLVNCHYGGVLIDAPRLRLHVDLATLGTQLEWFVENDSPTLGSTNGDTLAYEENARERRFSGLSTAQSRWARWSISLALMLLDRSEAPPTPLCMLIDEPEAALHRAAEAQMSSYLAELAQDPRMRVFVATHTPELLDLAAARVYQVARTSGQRSVRQLDAVTRENMLELGLHPSDLLRRQRGIVLVEGTHDQTVLEAFFGELFRALRVDVLPVRGATQLTPAKIGWLFQYTPAHIFVMLDNISTGEVARVWKDATDELATSGLNAASQILDVAECLKTEEGKILRQLLQDGLAQGRESRITPHGLSSPDIIDYLPVERFVPGGTSWDELRRRHADARQDTKNVPRDFKKWLEVQLRADFGEDAIREAVEACDFVPADLLRLAKEVEARVTAPMRVTG
jgi:energy-coupling factor transporter ATP-binding protein EcfA2